jgi:hypothetical protein
VYRRQVGRQKINDFHGVSVLPVQHQQAHSQAPESEDLLLLKTVAGCCRCISGARTGDLRIIRSLCQDGR